MRAPDPIHEATTVDVRPTGRRRCIANWLCILLLTAWACWAYYREQRTRAAIEAITAAGAGVETEVVGRAFWDRTGWSPSWAPRRPYSVSAGRDARAWLPHLKRVRGIRQFRGSCCRIDDEMLWHLRDQTELRWLELDGNPIKGPGLRHVTGLQQLESLALWQTPVGDEGLRHIGELRNLKQLLLTGTQVTDAGLGHLAGLPNLEELWLGPDDYDSITLAGLMQLAKCPRLRYLETGGLLPEDDLRQLQEAMPECDVW